MKERAFNIDNVTKEAAAEYEIQFGTHINKQLKNIPVDYLRWVQSGTEIIQIGDNIDAFLGKHPTLKYFDPQQYMDKLLK